MVNPNAAKNARWFMYLSVCLLLTLAVVIAARSAGRWLVREDTLSSADAIVVLSGIMPYPRRGSRETLPNGERARSMGEPTAKSCRRLAEIRHPVCR
jgi:hypothetical protein